MKWYEYSVSHGVRRFRTQAEAEASKKKAEANPYWEGEGDGNPVYPVDTDSAYFWHEDEDDVDYVWDDTTDPGMDKP